MSRQRLVEIAIKAKDESKGAFDSLQRSLDGGRGRMALFAAGAAAVATAVVVATQKLYSFTAEMARLGDQMDKMSLRTGIAVEELSAFGFALQRGGGQIQDLETATRRLSRVLGDFQQGTDRATQAFARLGMRLGDVVGRGGQLRSMDELLPMIADGLRDIGSQAERMDIAQELFGRGGTALLPMLQEGAEGIAKMRREMERYGGTMTTEFASKSAEFADSQTNLATATQRLKEALAEPFLGPFTNAVNKLAETIGAAVKIPDYDPALTSGPGRVKFGDPEALFGGSWQFDTFVNRLAEAHQEGVEEGVALAAERAAHHAAFMGSGVPGRDRIPEAAMDDMLWYNELLWENLRQSNEATEDWTRGLDDHIAALRAAEGATEMMSGALLAFAQGLEMSLDSAFYTALTSTRAFGRAFVEALHHTFADVLSRVASRAIVGGIFGGGGGAVAGEIGGIAKAMPGAGYLDAQGRMGSMAASHYSKVFVT